MIELTKNEFMENKFSSKALKLLVLILLYVLLLGTNNTYIYQTSLTPFGVSLLMSLLFIDFNGYILGGLYLGSSIGIDINVYKMLSIINVVLVISLIQYLKDKNKIKLNKFNVYVFTLFAMMMGIITNIGTPKETLAMVVAVILALMFLFASITFLDATIGKGMLGHINLDEKICGCVILLVFCVGISNATVYIFNLGLIFSTIIILVVCRLCGVSTTLLCGVLVGIGFSIFYLNPIYISMFVVVALGAIAFKCRWKILSAISFVLSYILFLLLFNVGLSIGEVLSVCMGAMIYLFIPSKYLMTLTEIFAKTKTIAVENIFNSAKTDIVSRIKDLSVIFKEMDNVYRGMVKGNLSDEKAKEILREETIAGICSNCENRDRCFRNTGSFMDNAMDTIISLGYEKGKLMLIDLPEYMTTNCIRLNSIIQYYNNLLLAYSDYRGAVSNLDTSRVLIADQLYGVSKLLESLSKEVDINVSIDNKYETIIKERLSYAGILCLECVVYEKSVESKTINLIVKKSHYNDKKIEKIVSKAFNVRFRICGVERSQVVGAVNVILKNCPNYDIAFGSAISTKTGKIVSGDTHSIIPIGDGKYIVSICDGMGSGKEANNISTLTLSLIENFYRAGFDNDVILSSINKLLSLNEVDNFSTIDLCMIDCRKNLYDFIKLGASNGYIKRDNGEVEIIECSNLPIGVIENIKPHITKLCVSPMDIVVLVSDGISDALGESLKDIIKFSENLNPQTLADEILNSALSESGGVSADDMTVVCVRVFEFV